MRAWSLADCDFGACAADMAALFLEQADRLGSRPPCAPAGRASSATNAWPPSAGWPARSPTTSTTCWGRSISSASRWKRIPETDVAAHGGELRRTVDFGSRLVEQLLLFGRESAFSGESVDLVVCCSRPGRCWFASCAARASSSTSRFGRRRSSPSIVPSSSRSCSICASTRPRRSPPAGWSASSCATLGPTSRLARAPSWPSWTTDTAWTLGRRSTSSSLTFRPSRPDTASAWRPSTGCQAGRRDNPGGDRRRIGNDVSHRPPPRRRAGVTRWPGVARQLSAQLRSGARRRRGA